MDLRLSELICVRICHDLVGATGAVSNGIELLEEGPSDFLSDISSLIGKSSKVLSDRLKFFRAAFGIANNSLSDKEKYVKLIENYMKTLGSESCKFEIDINIKKESNNDISKAIMLLCMICGDVMPKGGKIKITSNYDSQKNEQENLLFEELENHTLSLEASASLLRIPENFDEIIENYNTKGSAEEIINRAEPKTIPLVLLILLLSKFELNIKLSKEELRFFIASN